MTQLTLLHLVLTRTPLPVATNLTAVSNRVQPMDSNAKILRKSFNPLPNV